MSQRDHTALLHYDYETPSGEYAWEALEFDGLVAYTFTHWRHCTPDQVTALDRLVQSDAAPPGPGSAEPARGLSTFRIYFDEIGCYEVVASGFVAPTREAAG